MLEPMQLKLEMVETHVWVNLGALQEQQETDVPNLWAMLLLLLVVLRQSYYVVQADLELLVSFLSPPAKPYKLTFKKRIKYNAQKAW